MIPGASLQVGPFVGASKYGCLSVDKAGHKLCPVLLVGRFFNPVLKGAVIIDGNFRHICKQETKILHHKVLVVEKWMSYLLDMTTACSQHLLCWPVGWTTYCLLETQGML